MGEFVGTPVGHGIPWAGPVTVPFVPAGVPALTALVVAELPVKVSAGTVPEDPVNDGAATVPAGVKLTVPFVPAGVKVSLPPMVPTSPRDERIPYGTTTSNYAISYILYVQPHTHTLH